VARNVAGRANVDLPAGGCGDEVAAGHGVGERTVQRVAPSDRMVCLRVVDASCEVVVEVLAKVTDGAQAMFGRFAVVCHREAERRMRAVVDHTGTPTPGQKVGGLGQVLAPPARVLAPGDGVDKIKRRMAADQLDRLRTGGSRLRGHALRSYYIAGILAATIAGYVAQVALLSFVTLRAYPPGAKRPMVRFVLFTMVFSALVPLIYLGWLWMTGKKWPEAAFDPAG
jgi:hypothetical protein